MCRQQLEVLKAWKRERGAKVEIAATSLRILPGYRIDFGEPKQLSFNFEGLEIRDYNPQKVAVLYRHFL